MDEKQKKALEDYYKHNPSVKLQIDQACEKINEISHRLDIDDVDIVFTHAWDMLNKP